MFLFQSIYNAEIRVDGYDCSAMLSRDKARKAMHESRIKSIPACPEDIGEALQLLDNTDDDGTPRAELKKSVLSHCTWMEKQKRHHAILLARRDLFNDVQRDSTFYFVDGTFSNTPRQARTISMRGSQV